MIRVHVNPQYQQYADFLRTLPSEFEQQGSLIRAARNVIKRMRAADGHEFIVKMYKRPNFALKLRYMFTGICKAQKANKFAFLYQQAGVLTPAAAGYVAVTRGGMLANSYLVCEEGIGIGLEHEQLADKRIVEGVVAQLVTLHKAGLMPGDLNFSNILTSCRDGEWRFEFIDINRSYIIHNPTKEDCARNMFRLTHVRESLCILCREYARQRGWDEDEYYAMVLKCLERFEHKKQLLRKLKLKK